jgi:hypothetical protein
MRSKPVTKPPTRTTAKLGWETTPPPERSKWTVGRIGAVLTIPLLAIVALLVRELVAGGPEPSEAPHAASLFGSNPPPQPPQPAIAPRLNTDEAPLVAVVETKKPTVAKKSHSSSSTPADPPIKTVVSEGVHTIKDPDPPAPPPVEAPPPPPPPPVEAPPAELSSAVVQGVAGDHARELAKCEGTEPLHGDISVRFQIDANGSVIKSQISSSLRKPIIEGCILRSIQRWKFPKQGQPGVRGVYSLSFQ